MKLIMTRVIAVRIFVRMSKQDMLEEHVGAKNSLQLQQELSIPLFDHVT